jgi:hypothetical protein
MRELNDAKVAIIEKGDVWEAGKYDLVLVNTNMSIRKPNSICSRRLYEVIYERVPKNKQEYNISVSNIIADEIRKDEIRKSVVNAVTNAVTPDKKKKSEKYSFVVTKPTDIDFDRIIREVKEDNPESIGFILTINPAVGAAVCLFPKTVARFISTDKFMIGGRYVDGSWGAWVGQLAIEFDGDEYVIEPKNVIGKNRMKVMIIAKSEIGETIKTLKKMKEHQKRIKVKVNPI